MYKRLSEIKYFITSDDYNVRVKDVYFDMEKRKIEQFVCDIGGLFFSHCVLISPLLVESQFDLKRGSYFQLFTSREKLKSFRRRESVKTQSEEMSEYYRNKVIRLKSVVEENNSIYSLTELKNFTIDSPDNQFGVFNDFIIDEDSLSIKSLVVELGPVYGNELKMIPIEKVKNIDWMTGSISVALRNTLADELLPVSLKYLYQNNVVGGIRLAKM